MLNHTCAQVFFPGRDHGSPFQRDEDENDPYGDNEWFTSSTEGDSTESELDQPPLDVGFVPMPAVLPDAVLSQSKRPPQVRNAPARWTTGELTALQTALKTHGSQARDELVCAIPTRTWRQIATKMSWDRRKRRGPDVQAPPAKRQRTAGPVAKVADLPVRQEVPQHQPLTDAFFKRLAELQDQERKAKDALDAARVRFHATDAEQRSNLAARLADTLDITLLLDVLERCRGQIKAVESEYKQAQALHDAVHANVAAHLKQAADAATLWMFRVDAVVDARVP